MDVEFDAAKDAANRAKHRVGLRDAERFDMETALVAADDRQDYGEDRWIAVGFIDAQLHVLVFTERNGWIRPISLRKALKREEQQYEREKARYGF